MIDVEYYNAHRGYFAPLIEDRGKVEGFWLVGNDYRNKSRLYGAYPPGYLKRMALLFPQAERVLHLFSGSLHFEEDNIITVDINPDMYPDFVMNAEDLSELYIMFDLILADPPYGEQHLKYGTQRVNKRKVIQQCATRLVPGGHLVWLDTIWPQFSKKDGWRLRGTIGFNQSTNHRVRQITILEKVVSFGGENAE